MMFSVLLSVYHRDNPEYFQAALDSILNQTHPCNEIVLIKDGPLGSALDNVIQYYEVRYPELFNVISFSENRGLGIALREGVGRCKYSIIARMDSDDIASKNRFEVQLNVLKQHPELMLVGSNISEFQRDIHGNLRTKAVPEGNASIMSMSKIRNPINHMSVMFRKESVLAAGNYQHMPYFEDYDLWMRMLMKGMPMYNIQQNLVYARIGNDMIGKRHGIKYALYEANFFLNLYRRKFLNTGQFIRAVVVRLPLRLVPKSLLSNVYKCVLRKAN